jgi:hypothetical protein
MLLFIFLRNTIDVVNRMQARSSQRKQPHWMASFS